MEKHKIQAILCLAGSAVLYGVLTLTAPAEAVVSADGRIAREQHGGQHKYLDLYVAGLDEQDYQVAVEVAARSYTEEEAIAVFTKIMDQMETRIRGDNQSLMTVDSDLTLPARWEEYDVRLLWYSSDPDVIDATGKLGAVCFTTSAPEAFDLTLHVQLSYGAVKRDYEMPVRVIPGAGTGRQRLTWLQQEIERREEGQKTEAFLSLPMEYEGKALHYRTEEDTGYAILLVLGIILAVLCYAKAQTDAQTRTKNREKQLLLDYAEIVSKLMVFIGAGMTIRLVWERIVNDYERSRKAGKIKQRAAYEEMCMTLYEMESGVSEGEAFRKFGRRCQLQPYLKLSSLLEQNRKEGSKHLRVMLQAEMQDAWELRKNLARKMGEEAGTKLLAPLFLMLGIVMVMIMVPAMMTMG